MNRYPMPSLDPVKRIQTFDEVATGYTWEMAQAEAGRCLHCKNAPCIQGCPVGINIPDFIQAIRNEQIDEAYAIITRDNLFPAICGRVCPQESQCEALCVRNKRSESVAIGRLERFVGDHVTTCQIDSIVEIPHKVAIVGSGPSGLTCAFELRRKGFQVTVFEALHLPGGVLTYGIPEFRLPKSIVNKEIDHLRAMGVHIQTNVVIGKTLTIDQLFSDGYEAIYLASGAGLPKFLNIPGESYNGVFSANEILTRINLMKAYQSNSDTPLPTMHNIAVIGGGNVAMDAARSLKRLSKGTVYLVYRRSEAEMPARKEEIEHAKEEGITMMLLTNPQAILADDTFRVRALQCIKMELTEPDESGRRRPVEIPDSSFLLEVDTVVEALGNFPNPLIRKSTKQLEVDRSGCFVVDEHLQTSIPLVYAGGDAVTGAATVILAMGAGKKAAQSIYKKIIN
ncbi:MAG: NADPH-dependent glutamate synthase [Bacilli bacterium]|jgi:glutamate synthase (NADPH/NADH) small chain|nr:NADPH-dependent glutamate synthase [Bacilli bacterium]